MKAAYYNEIDPFAAQWLRNLISAGLIAPGDVDERSIEDVHPSDLKPYAQCHFFAGIGVWSYALRQAGWPDDKPVWTGSCPCQPFSSAGKRTGFADERHLWPAWFHLIEQCRPAIIFGEQVASKDGLAWLDLVQADLEVAGYASGAVDLCAAGVGAPHIRQRLWWVAERLGHHHHQRLEGHAGYGDGSPGRAITAGSIVEAGGAVGLADDTSIGRKLANAGRLAARDRAQGVTRGLGAGGGDLRPGPTNGFWRDADWLFCRDGKFRPVEPGFEQMADGAARSLGRVRASDIEKIQEEVNDWAIRHQADAREALRRVWRDLRTQALCEWEIGRFSGVQSPAVLLSFLRQLTEQGWRFSDALAREGAAAPQIVVRVMRFDPSAARTPLRRELAEQPSGEPSDPMRELSSIVAHYAEKCWGEACRQKAGAASFPLTRDAPARVGRLRAYGNAINAEAAKVFIEAVMDWLGYGDL